MVHIFVVVVAVDNCLQERIQSYSSETMNRCGGIQTENHPRKKEQLHCSYLRSYSSTMVAATPTNNARHNAS